MSRTRKSAWSLGSGLLFTVVTICVGIFTTPILLRLLGAERFGAYRVLLDWATYLPLLEFGLGGALWARLAVASAKRDEALIERLLIAGWRAYFRVALLILCSGFVLLLLLPNIIKATMISDSELRISWLVFLGLTLFYPFVIYRLLAEARQQSYVVSLLNTIQSLLTTTLLLLTAWAGWKLIGQAIGTVLAQIPTALVLTLIGRRSYSINWLAKPDAEAKASLKELNWSTFLYNISYRVGILSDNIIIAFFIGPTAVVPFFLTQRLAALSQGQLLNIGNSTWAGLTELYSQGETETFRARMFELTSFVSGLSLAVLAPIAAYNQYFITRWVGATNFAGEAVSLVVCINVWLGAIFYLWGWTLSGTGNISSWTSYSLSFIIINLTVSIIGTIKLGLVGPLVGTLTGYLFVHVWAMPRVLQNIFDWSPVSLWRCALSPLVWALPYTCLVWLIARKHAPQDWLSLLIAIILVGLGGLLLWWTISLSSNERAVWLGRVKSALGR
jgi:O-antigen/teichoic acid export membrane protein